jgi:hypothetical protein
MKGNMRGIIVRDLVPAGFLQHDLADYLDLLGDIASGSLWGVDGVWATGPRSDELATLNGREGVPGSLLCELARSVDQVIDGEFRCHLTGEGEPWAVVRAVDSTRYEFYCRDEVLLASVRGRFRDVTEGEWTA